MNFTDLGLSQPLLQAIQDQGYEAPLPIQAQAIPDILNGRDVLASAQTGTGKTAAFVLPLLQRLSTQPRAPGNRALVLILTPTRELAAQVLENVKQYGKYLSLRKAAIFGGVKMGPQMMALRGGIEVLVATPGRLLDLYRQNAVRFDNLQTLVLDEADRMLDMGFINDIKNIVSKTPKKRQTLLFSATFSPEIRELAKAFLFNPIAIDMAPANTAVKKINQTMHPVDKGRKVELLCHLIKENNWHQALVFTRTKHTANKLTTLLMQERIQATAFHGNKSQAQRTKALRDFKSGKIQILVATDIAARGIDIDALPLVVNFDLPHTPEDYIHRIGRTGRAGAEGQALSLISADESKPLQHIERLMKQTLERVEIEGFEPTHAIPVSRPHSVSKKPGAARHHRKPHGSKGHHAHGHRDAHRTHGKTERRSSETGNAGAGEKRGFRSAKATTAPRTHRHAMARPAKRAVAR